QAPAMPTMPPLLRSASTRRSYAGLSQPAFGRESGPNRAPLPTQLRGRDCSRLLGTRRIQVSLQGTTGPTVSPLLAPCKNWDAPDCSGAKSPAESADKSRAVAASPRALPSARLFVGGFGALAGGEDFAGGPVVGDKLLAERGECSGGEVRANVRHEL